MPIYGRYLTNPFTFPNPFLNSFHFLSWIREPLHPLQLFPNQSMAKTRGGHSFRPQVQPSSPPPAGAAAPASVVVGQSSPPATAPGASQAPIPAAPAPHMYDTRVGPTPPHPRLSWRAPSPKKAQTSGQGESSRGPKSLIPHLFRDQLMTSPRICLLLLLSGVLSSIAASLQAIQIAVPGKYTVKHVMIFQLLLPILSS